MRRPSHSTKPKRWALVALVVLGFGAYRLERYVSGGRVLDRPDATARDRAREASPARHGKQSSVRNARDTDESRPVASGDDHLEASPGDRFVYRLQGHWLAGVATSKPSGTSHPADWKLEGDIPDRVTTDLAATLETVVLAKRDQEYLVRFSLQNPDMKVRAGAREVSAASLSLESGALARMTDDGRILGYRFDAGTPPETQAMLQALFSLTHQFVLRRSDAPWTVSGLYDDVGGFSARFGWHPPARFPAETAPAALRRTVLSYDLSTRQRVTSSSSEAVFAEGWLSGADVREERRARVADVISTSSSVHLRLTLVERGSRVVDASEVPDASEPWLQRPRPVRSTATTRSNDEPTDEATTGDASAQLAELLARIGDLVRSGSLESKEGYDLWRDVAGLISRAPDDVLPVLMTMIGEGALDRDAASWIESAIGKAGGDGSAAAVASLAELMASPSLSDDARLEAVLAAHQLGGFASTDLIDAATGILLDAEKLGEGSQLPMAASLLLGTLAGDPDLPIADRTLLEAGLDVAKANWRAGGDPDVYFRALANTGRVDLIESAFEYVGDPDERVRQAADVALSTLGGDPRVADTLLHAASEDPSESVRSAAVAAMANLDATTQITNGLLRSALDDASALVRSSAVDALAELALHGSTAAHQSLEQLAASGSDSVRRSAQQHLADLDAPPPPSDGVA